VSVPPLRFEEVYAAHADFVWRSALRLGVTEHSVEDVVQEVFLTVYRRLPEFEGRSQVRTWLFGILLHVVRAHRRTLRRKGRFFGLGGAAPIEPEALPLPEHQGPEVLTEQAQAARILRHLLGGLDEDKRALFVMVELEEVSVVDAAEVLGWNLNTAHARLRAARRDFERLAAQVRASLEAREKGGRHG
jgi:RNA polymerase sigma-70 factor (ECF subfamily)